MGATIEQITGAAFDDRPQRENAVGMRCTLTTGPGRHYVTRELPTPQGRLGVRVMVSVGNLSGGPVLILQGRDSEDLPTFGLWLAPNGVVYATGADEADQIDGALVPGLLWQCLEVVLQPGKIQLWINGEKADELLIDAQPPTALLRIGVIDKLNAVTAVIDLDEIKAGTGYQGPVVLPAAYDAADTSRWLVLYAADNPDSVTWVQWYRAARKVPWANLIGLTGYGTGENLTMSNALTLRGQVLSYAATNRIKLSGILIGHGLPGTVDNAYSLASVLASKSATSPIDNPYFQAGQVGQDTIELPSIDLTGPILLVGELNAPSLVTAQALTSEVQERVQQSLTGLISTLQPGVDELRWDATEWLAWLDLADFVRSLAGEQVRLKQVDGAAFGAALAFTRSSTPGPENQNRTLAATIADNSALTVRSGSTWAKAALQAGYPIVLGMVGSLALIDRPNPAPLFAALRAGKTLAEAVLYSMPGLLSNWRIIGDPLAKLPMPQQGFELRRADSGQLVEVMPYASGISKHTQIPAGRLSAGEWSLNFIARDRYGTPSTQTPLQIVIDAEGNTAAAPVQPRNLVALPSADGMVALAWEAVPAQGRGEASLWRVYDEDGMLQGSLTPAARQRVFALNLGPYAHGETLRWSLVPVTARGVEGQPVAFPIVVADANGPAAPILLKS